MLISINDDAYIQGLIIPVQLSIEAYLNAPIESFVKDDPDRPANLACHSYYSCKLLCEP